MRGSNPSTALGRSRGQAVPSTMAPGRSDLAVVISPGLAPSQVLGVPQGALGRCPVYNRPSWT